MAKVISYIDEQEVGFMEEVDVEFVSLVGHAANRTPWKIIKSEDGNMPQNSVYQLLVGKSVDEETLNKTLEDLALKVQEKDEESMDGFVVYKTAEDESLDLENKQVACMDQDNHIYAVIAPLKEEVEPNKDILAEKELDYTTMDNVAENLFATMDIVLGVLRQGEGTPANKKNTIMNALDNFKKYAEAALMNSKSEDTIDIEKLEVKGENLEDLFYQVIDSEVDDGLNKEEWSEEIQKQFEDAHKALDEKIDGFKDSIYTKMNELLEEKVNGMVDEKLETLKVDTEVLVSNETFEKKVKELADSLEELKNTTKKRHSEVDDKEEKTETKKQPKTERSSTYKFPTAV